jgi:hypothetical protein
MRLIKQAWIIIGTHSALQGAMVYALSDNDGHGSPNAEIPERHAGMARHQEALMRRLLFVALMCATSGVARADTDGNSFLRSCDVDPGGIQGWCIDYAQGLADGLMVWQILSPDTARACIAPEIAASQLREVAVRYLRAHPEKRHQSAGIVLANAFVEAWPCGD